MKKYLIPIIVSAVVVVSYFALEQSLYQEQSMSKKCTIPYDVNFIERRKAISAPNDGKPHYSIAQEFSIFSTVPIGEYGIEDNAHSLILKPVVSSHGYIAMCNPLPNLEKRFDAKLESLTILVDGIEIPYEIENNVLRIDVNNNNSIEIVGFSKISSEKIPTLSDTPEIFRDGSTKFVNPDHESLKYYKTSQVIDDTYLGKNVQQWQDAWEWELQSNYELYKDEFYEKLGRLLVKNEITQVMNQVGIVNVHDDFKVHQGYSLTSLPPHIGFTAVINATDGNSYLVEASSHSNRVNYYAITQLTFFDTAQELSLTDIQSPSQTIHILPEDRHKSRADPSDLIIHVDNNLVNFVNDTPETIRIQESGTGEIEREHELTWIGPTILPFENGQMIFDKPGIYEWDARTAPTIENPLWWESHAGGEIVVLADDADELPLEDKLRMGREILKNSEIPTAGMGVGNADNALKVSLRPAVYDMLPDAVQYYQDRAEQLVPFDIPIIIEDPSENRK